MVGFAIDIQRQNKEALKWILNYAEKRDSYIAQSASFSELGATAYTGMPHGSEVGDPTLKKGITLIDLEYQKKWLMVIEKMELTLSDKRKIFLELRRRAELIETSEVGRPGWVGYVQAKYADWHYRQYGKGYPPSKQTMCKWMNDIVDVAVRLAIREGVL